MLVEGQTASAQSEEVTPEVKTETPVLSATQQAAADGDVSAYRAARAAERVGKVAAPVPAEKPAAKAAPGVLEEPKQVSKRQQQINDYERRIAEQTAEIARLKTPAPAAAPAQSTTPKSEPGKPQTLAEIVARPDPAKPLLKDAEFFAAHPDAEYSDYAQYVTRHTAAVDRAAEHSRSQMTQGLAAQQARMDGFNAKLTASAAADPEFGKKLSPDVAALVPIAWMKPDAPFTVDNAIAEEIIEAGDHAPDLMLHLSQHPDDLRKLRATENPRQLSAAIGRFVGRLEREAAADAEPETKHVSDAPDPATTLGKRPGVAADPIAGAVKAQDFTRYQAEKRARLLAQRSGK